MSTISCFVVRAHHLDWPAGLQIVKCQIDRCAAIVARAFRRICDEQLFVLGSRFPKYFRHIPRAISVVNEQAVTRLLQLPVDANESFRRRALQEGTRLRIENRTEEIVSGGVTNIELDRWIELS